MALQSRQPSLHRPSVFIGSSSEGLDVAAALQEELENYFDIERWDQGIFEISFTFIESLEKILSGVDFAILVMTPDDIVESRDATSNAPRDNVIFELGLFMGKLGRSRCFFVYPDSLKTKIPSDLLGVYGATFRSRSDDNLRASVSTAASKIRKAINDLGRKSAFKLFFSAAESSHANVADISGKWIGYIKDTNGAEKKVSEFFIEQNGSFIKARAERASKTGGIRTFDYEGRLVSGQLILIFEEGAGKGFIIGTSVLHLSGDRQQLKGVHSYYGHDDNCVVSTPVVYKKSSVS